MIGFDVNFINLPRHMRNFKMYWKWIHTFSYLIEVFILSKLLKYIQCDVNAFTGRRADVASLASNQYNTGERMKADTLSLLLFLPRKSHVKRNSVVLAWSAVIMCKEIFLLRKGFVYCHTKWEKIEMCRLEGRVAINFEIKPVFAYCII